MTGQPILVKMKTRFKFIAAILLIGAVALIGFASAIRNSSAPVRTVTTATELPKLRGQVTDVTEYAEIRKQFGDQVSVQHFPKVIPSDATEVHFYFIPDFLQGGTSLQLRLKLPPDKIDEQYAQFNPVALRSYIGGDSNIHANLPDGMPTTSFSTSGSNVSTFPQTYEILVLGAEPAGSPDFKWNHGTSYGIAIDKSASDIVYWLEDW
jgi:hypothetical protein